MSPYLGVGTPSGPEKFLGGAWGWLDADWVYSKWDVASTESAKFSSIFKTQHEKNSIRKHLHWQKNVHGVHHYVHEHTHQKHGIRLSSFHVYLLIVIFLLLERCLGEVTVRVRWVLSRSYSAMETHTNGRHPVKWPWTSFSRNWDLLLRPFVITMQAWQNMFQLTSPLFWSTSP